MNNAQIGKAFSLCGNFRRRPRLRFVADADAIEGPGGRQPTPVRLHDRGGRQSDGFIAPGTATALAGQSGGKGESAVQIRMPAGTLRRLRVKLTTQTVPSAGILTIVVRRNGNNTTLTCELSKAGECGSNEVVAFAENDKLSVRMINNFTGSGVMGLTYVLLFN